MPLRGTRKRTSRGLSSLDGRRGSPPLNCLLPRNGHAVGDQSRWWRVVIDVGAMACLARSTDVNHGNDCQQEESQSECRGGSQTRPLVGVTVHADTTAAHTGADPTLPRLAPLHAANQRLNRRGVSRGPVIDGWRAACTPPLHYPAPQQLRCGYFSSNHVEPGRRYLWPTVSSSSMPKPGRLGGVTQPWRNHSDMSPCASS